MERYSEYKDSGLEWLGEIPRHWEVIKNKYLFSESDERNVFGEYKLLSFSKSKGIIPYDQNTDKESSAEDIRNYKVLHKGQLLENRLQAWNGMFQDSSVEGCVSPDYSVFNLIYSNANIKYYSYLFKTDLYIAQWANASKGIGSGFNRLYTPQFGKIVSLVPPIEEQNAIVSYLDKVTSKIDAAIAQQQKMIELLNERKQIIINNAVTKGLDPTAKMKPSGIPWLGNIPAHWEVKKIKYMATQITTPSCNINKIGLENIESGTGKYIESNSIFEGNGIEFTKGDVLYGKLRPYLKKVYLANERGNAIGDFFVFRPRKNITGKYFQMLLLSQHLTDVINSSTYGSKMPRVSIDFMGGLHVPCPPYDEQASIVNDIEEHIKPIEAIIEKCKKRFFLLQERKQIIISDFITGKIKVSGTF